MNKILYSYSNVGFGGYVVFMFEPTDVGEHTIMADEYLVYQTKGDNVSEYNVDVQGVFHKKNCYDSLDQVLQQIESETQSKINKLKEVVQNSKKKKA